MRLVLVLGCASAAGRGALLSTPDPRGPELWSGALVSAPLELPSGGLFSSSSSSGLRGVRLSSDVRDADSESRHSDLRDWPAGDGRKRRPDGKAEVIPAREPVGVPEREVLTRAPPGDLVMGDLLIKGPDSLVVLGPARSEGSRQREWRVLGGHTAADCSNRRGLSTRLKRDRGDHPPGGL